MKQIKDAYMTWLDAEIEKCKTMPTRTAENMTRQDVLEECRTRLVEVITEEFHKLSEKKEGGHHA